MREITAIGFKSRCMSVRRRTHYCVLMIAAILFPPVLFSSPDVELDLTAAEKAWLNDHPVIRLASDIAWPPFEWIDSERQPQGIASDYMKLIEKKLGVRFEQEKDKPWPEVVEAVKARKLDVFSCIAKNVQRMEYVNFTRPYLSFPMVIITSNEVSYIDGVNDLIDMTVSVVDGYATHEYLTTNHPELTLYVVDTSEAGLAAVSQGKANAFVDNIATATHIMHESGLTNLKISGEMPIRYELSMAVRKDWPELVSILQRALDSISDEQRRNIQNKWIGVRFEHGIDYSLFWKSLIVFILIVSFLYFYNRKLSREINQRKVAEDTAIKLRNDADKANQAKSEFLAVMSHELRTPLTSIIGALGLLTGNKKMGVSDDARKMLLIASENSQRLKLLVDDILDVEKLMAGQMVFQQDTTSVASLVAKAVAANQGYADQYDVSFMVDIDACDDCCIIADEHRLMQVMTNLISNAVKYSPKKGCVHIIAQGDAHKVRVSVADSGEGIPVVFHDEIFSHFSQADTSDTREKGGTGLGLAISKEIIERQGGVIGFTSVPGQGATFYFEFDMNEVKT